MASAASLNAARSDLRSRAAINGTRVGHPASTGVATAHHANRVGTQDHRLSRSDEVSERRSVTEAHANAAGGERRAQLAPGMLLRCHNQAVRAEHGGPLKRRDHENMGASSQANVRGAIPSTRESREPDDYPSLER
jgi:hypothetical protein